MSRQLRLGFAAALAGAAFTLLPGSASASDFESGDAVRAAQFLGGGATRFPLRTATDELRRSAKTVEKLKYVKILRVRRDAALVRRRGSRWSERKWSTLKSETRVCLASAAFMTSDGMLNDRVLDRIEWSRYAAFGPQRLSKARTRAIKFPIRFDVPGLLSANGDEAIACALGLGFARYFGKGADAPRPQ